MQIFQGVADTRAQPSLSDGCLPVCQEGWAGPDKQVFDTRKGSGWQTSPSYFLAPKQLSKTGEVGGGQQQESFRCHHCPGCAQGPHPALQGSVRAPSCPEPGQERQWGGRRNQGRKLSLQAHSKENQKGLQKRKVKGASEKKSQGMSQPVSKFWSKLKKVFSWLHWVFTRHTGFL